MDIFRVNKTGVKSNMTKNCGIQSERMGVTWDEAGKVANDQER